MFADKISYTTGITILVPIATFDNRLQILILHVLTNMPKQIQPIYMNL